MDVEGENDVEGPAAVLFFVLVQILKRAMCPSTWANYPSIASIGDARIRS